MKTKAHTLSYQSSIWESYSDYNILLRASMVHGRQTCSHIDKKPHDTGVLYSLRSLLENNPWLKYFRKDCKSYTKVDNYDI
jgi:hypothetical protein